jgi:hypothetical protein
MHLQTWKLTIFYLGLPAEVAWGLPPFNSNCLC